MVSILFEKAGRLCQVVLRGGLEALELDCVGAAARPHVSCRPIGKLLSLSVLRVSPSEVLALLDGLKNQVTLFFVFIQLQDIEYLQLVNDFRSHLYVPHF